MYNFLPDSHRSYGSIDMFAISDRPTVAPRRRGSAAVRASVALARMARTRRVTPPRTVPARTVPSSPAITAL